jgi:hypothetical protein
MKKLALLLFVAVLLVACQSAATKPTPTPVEAMSNSVNDLVGVWSLGVQKLEFKADGTYWLFFGSGVETETIDKGNYTFDAGTVSYVTSSYCNDKPAKYQAYVTKQDGKPVSLRLQIVGSDSCTDRADVSGRIAKFQNP